MRRAARTDNNHAEIRETLRRMGWIVFDSSHVPGWVDLTPQHRPTLRTRPVEVKGPNGSLTPRQIELLENGHMIWILVTVQDCIDLHYDRLPPAQLCRRCRGSGCWECSQRGWIVDKEG